MPLQSIDCGYRLSGKAAINALQNHAPLYSRSLHSCLSSSVRLYDAGRYAAYVWIPTLHEKWSPECSAALVCGLSFAAGRHRGACRACAVDMSLLSASTSVPTTYTARDDLITSGDCLVAVGEMHGLFDRSHQNHQSSVGSSASLVKAKV
jgi:hypothetical protein